MDRTRTIVLLALALAAAGCKDMGIQGNWARLAEPDNRPSTPLVAATTEHAKDAGLIVDGRLWLPYGLPQPLSQSDLSAVGTSEAGTVYARSWDRPPYDRIFAPIAGQSDPLHSGSGQPWQVYAAVLGRSGPSDVPAHGDDAGSDSGHH